MPSEKPHDARGLVDHSRADRRRVDLVGGVQGAAVMEERMTREEQLEAALRAWKSRLEGPQEASMQEVLHMTDAALAAPPTPSVAGWEAGRPMREAPRDGTRILAWWPGFDEAGTNDGWATTWWGKSRDRVSDGWENAWEWERPDSGYAPQKWLPHPDAITPAPAPFPPPEADRPDGFLCLGWLSKCWQPIKWYHRWGWIDKDGNERDPKHFTTLPPAPEAKP